MEGCTRIGTDLKLFIGVGHLLQPDKIQTRGATRSQSHTSNVA